MRKWVCRGGRQCPGLRAWLAHAWSRGSSRREASQPVPCRARKLLSCTDPSCSPSTTHLVSSPTRRLGGGGGGRRTLNTQEPPTALPCLRTWSHPPLSASDPGSVVAPGDPSSRNSWEGVGLTCLMGAGVCQQPHHNRPDRRPTASDTGASRNPKKVQTWPELWPRLQHPI